MIRKLLFMGGFVLKTCHLFVLFAQFVGKVFVMYYSDTKVFL